MNDKYLKKLILLLGFNFFTLIVASDLKLDDWIEISEKASDSTFQLFVFKNVFNFLEPYKTPEQVVSSGSCFLINEEGYLLTNAHCVEEGCGFFVQMPIFGRHRFEADLIATWPERDLAMLKIKEDGLKKLKKKHNKIPYLSFGDSDAVKRAEEIIAVGFPLGQESIKVTSGVVSGIQTLGGQSLIQISAAINPGNSGGPSLNKNGKVIGISSSGIFGDGAQNVGYIIPMKEILVFVDYVQKKQKELDKKIFDTPLLIHSPLIGIIYQGSPEALIEYLNNPVPGGIYIIEVLKNSLAEKIGMIAGDMIYKINGYSLDRFGDVEVPWSKDKISLSALLNRIYFEDTIEIEVFRKGESIILKDVWKPANVLPIRFLSPNLEEVNYIIIGGLIIMELSMNHIRLLLNKSQNLGKYLTPKKQSEKVLIVSHVLSNSVAHHSRLIHPGMIIKKINDIEVKSLDDANEAIKNSLKTSYFTITFEENELFVANLERVLEDEEKLSSWFFYEISPIVKSLMTEFKKS